MEKKATIAHVAKEVGVSKTTISRYLNGNYEYMSEQTRQRIEEVITRLNYVPNSVARTLKSKKSMLIGVITNTLRYQVGAQTVTGINQVCTRYGYGTVICCSNDDPKKEAEMIQLCLNQQVDGMVIIPSSESPEPYLALREKGIPVVLCNRWVEGWPDGYVYVKHDELIYKIMDHLKEQGFEKVRFLQDVNLFHKRWMGDLVAERAEALFGMSREEAVVSVGKESTLVAEALDKLLHDYPDRKKAVLAVNTHTLFLTLQEIRRRDLRIPEDLGVCGYDAVGWSELVSPGITAICQPMRSLGAQAADQLIRQIQDPEAKPEHCALSGTITFRDSTRLK